MKGTMITTEQQGLASHSSEGKTSFIMAHQHGKGHTASQMCYTKVTMYE